MDRASLQTFLPGHAAAVESTSSDSESEEEDILKDRGQWGRSIERLLSFVGICVGLGNFWRFAYVCQRNGGGAFLIPFLICLVLCAVPMFFMEVALGQFSGRGAVTVWSICPLFKGIGISMQILSVMFSFYYNLIIAWTLYYLVRSCSAVLPWTTCSNWWNTPLCTEPWDATIAANVTWNDTFTGENSTLQYNVTTDISPKMMSNDSMSHTSIEEFWRFNTLRISDGLGDLGKLQWHLVLCFLVAWVIVCLCVIKGVKSIGKVVYVTATMPYLLLLIILVRAALLPGAVDGIIFYFKPDFEKILTVQVWLEACIQVFYSLGPSWGMLITLSSFNKFHGNCLRDTVLITSISEGTSMFCGLVVFTVMGTMAHKQGVHVSEVISSGPGLGFIAYPEALSQLPIPQLWSFLFFLMVLMIGLDSQFAGIEVVVTGFVDAFPKHLMHHRSLTTAIVCAVYFVIGLPLTCNGGMYIFQILDWYLGALVMAIAVIEMIVVCWIYGIDKFDDDVEMMLGRRIPAIFKILLCWVTPILLSIVLVFTVFHYKQPTYGTYTFPRYGEIIGWCLAGLPLLAILVVMVMELYTAEGSILQRMRQKLIPEASYGPRSFKYMAIYKQRNEKNSSLRDKVRSACVCLSRSNRHEQDSEKKGMFIMRSQQDCY